MNGIARRAYLERNKLHDKANEVVELCESVCPPKAMHMRGKGT